MIDQESLGQRHLDSARSISFNSDNFVTLVNQKECRNTQKGLTRSV